MSTLTVQARITIYAIYAVLYVMTRVVYKQLQVEVPVCDLATDAIYDLISALAGVAGWWAF